MAIGDVAALTFAAGRAEAEEVDFAAFAVQAGDAGLTLALSRGDVTLTVGGADRITVTPVATPRETVRMRFQT